MILLFLQIGGYRYVSDPLNELLTTYADTFTGIGDVILQSVAGSLLILYLCVYGWSLLTLIRFLARYTIRLVVCNSIIAFYDRPMSFIGGYKLHQLPSEVCDTLVSYLDLTRMDALFNFCRDYLAGMNMDGVHLMLRPMVWIGETFITIYEAIIWAAIPVSYDAVAVLTLLLPLFTFTLLIPGLAHMFWHCLGAIWQAAFYRVTAAAIVFCATTSTLSFLTHELNGDYSVEMFLAIMPKMCGLMLSWLLAFLIVGHLTSDIFKGTSSSGTGFGSMMARIL